MAIIDTGIDYLHPFIKPNIHVTSGAVGPVNFGVDFSSAQTTSMPFDQHGHGTHVAGIIKSIFPEIKILSLKYYNPKASGQKNLQSTIEALKYAIDHNVDIINYSGGGPEPSILEHKLLKDAERKGILIIAAAGNDNANIDKGNNAYYPASYGLSNIITVTAHDKSGRLLKSSNWGLNSVHISAPGSRIRSSTPNRKNSYMTGTSQATAFVTGVASLLKSQYPNLSASQIKNILIASTKKLSALKKLCLSGGILNANRALDLAQKQRSKRKVTTRRLATTSAIK